MTEEEEKIFFAGARIKERLNLIHIEFTFIYYTKAMNYLTVKEKI